MKRGFFHAKFVCAHENVWMKMEKYQIQTKGTASVYVPHRQPKNAPKAARDQPSQWE